MSESEDALLMITPNKAKQSQQMPKKEAFQFELKQSCFAHVSLVTGALQVEEIGGVKRCAKLENSTYTWRNFRDVPPVTA